MLEKTYKNILFRKLECYILRNKKGSLSGFACKPERYSLNQFSQVQSKHNDNAIAL